tara:strand:- start:763 stop:2451 length:1689 start_codon:yes stop_codon:yes gene_type:complete
MNLRDFFFEFKSVINIIKATKVNIYFLTFLITVNTLLEILSVASFVPIFLYLIKKGETSVLDIYLSKYLNIDFDIGINFFLLLIVLAFTIKFVFQIFYVRYKSLFFYQIHQDVTNKIFSNYLADDYLNLIKVNSSHIIKNVITETQNFIALLRSITEIFQNFLTMVMFIIALLFISFKYTILILIFYIFIGYFVYKIFKQKNLVLGDSRQQSNFYIIKYIRETFQSIIDIKMFKMEKYLKKKFNISNSKYLESFQKQNFISNMPKLFIEFVVIISFSLFIFSMIKSNVSNENILFISSVLGIILIRLLPLIPNFLINIQSVLFYYASLKVIKHRTSEKLVKKIYIKKHKFDQNIKKLILSEITFLFDDKEIIKKFNHTFEIGKNYFVSGFSGSGKSTLLNLISGLLEVKSGKISINNVPINEIDNYQSMISYVPQEVSLIDDTVLKNITFEENSEKINKHELNKIIEICSLGDLLKRLPEGLDTNLGERGIFISGGEKQRVGIARALYKKSPILIFDEATNSLNIEIGNKIFDYCIKNNNQIFIFTTHNNQIAEEKIIEIKL